jgi:hypothetical protein
MAENMEMSVAAKMLAVSPEMVYNNFCKLIFPVEHLPQTYTEFQENGGDDMDLFWDEFHVDDVIEKARDREMSISEAAYEVGAAVAEFREAVGPLKEKEVKKKPAPQKPQKPKLTSLEKQVGRMTSTSRCLCVYI